MTSIPIATLRAREIFHDAIERYQPDQWPAFLDAVCQTDDALRRQVERLLAAHGELNSFMGQPAVVVEATTDRTNEQPGTLIGPYKLLEQIGEGGMGVVYVAEQTEPVRRRVALKIIKPGMDTKQVIARFEAERQALAMMDHPNIARVLDAGTTEAGRPYFVMELVRGMPFTDYCNKVRLSPRQRLELFIDVSHAIQHAHQKGIIHRDLKPSNILITLHDGKPVVKVIDFGVAKAIGQQLTERTVYTALTQLVGTPLYMSPEQAELSGLDIDTRSDVYSLGVLLYELLTGQTPFDKDRLKSVSFDEMRRMIREDEPLRPSRRFSTLGAAAISTASQHRGVDERRLSRILSGELDWIVMKALEKDRSRRYESASALAADIQRYLSDEPVLACPPTAMYRFQKFARKHKPALFTAASLALCLLLGTTVSAWQAARATSAEAQAETNAQKAEEKAKEATQERDEAEKQRDEVKALADKLAAKEEQLQRTLYADHIHMAQAAWDNGDVRAMSDLLAQHVPQGDDLDRRNFEWHYLNRLANIGPLLSIKTGPGLYGRNLKLSSDRTRLIRFQPARTPTRNRNETTPATPPTFQAWNVVTGQEIFAVEISGIPDRTPSGWQPSPQFNPDAAYLVLTTKGWDSATKKPVPGELRIWSTQTGKEVFRLNGVVEDVLFSPDNKLLAIPFEDQSIKVWELQTGRERLSLKGQPERPHSMAFSPDGKRLAAAYQKWDDTIKAVTEGEIKIWDAQSGEQLKSIQGQSDWINDLVFSPDGQQLVTAVEDRVDRDSGIRLWDSQTGKALMTIRWDSTYVDNPVFNANGTRLIARGYKVNESKTSELYTKLWNVQTGQELLSLKAGDVQFSPDGKRVAYSDWRNFRTKVYDAQTGQIMLSVKDDGFGYVAFSPDSKRLATESGGVHVWDLQTGEETNHIKVFDGHVLAFSQDGKRLIGSGQTSAQIWDAEIQPQSGKKIPLPGVGLVGFPADTPGVISSDFTRIAGISDKTVKLFDAQTGHELRTLTGHDQKVYAVALSQDGKRVASSDGPHPPNLARGNETGGSVKVWDAETGKELFTIADLPHRIVRLKFSPDGQKLAGTPADGTLKVWDAQSGHELVGLGRRIPNFPASAMTGDSFAFSPDGKRLAWQGKLFDAATGVELVTFKNAANIVERVGPPSIATFSPDGKRVFGRAVLGRPVNGAAPPSANGVWDAETGELLFLTPVLKGVGPQGRLTISPDGKRLARGGKIWDAQTGEFLLSLSSDDTRQATFSRDGHRLAVVNDHGNEFTIYDATPLPEKP